MAGGRDIMATEKQRQFIKGVSFLRHWPIERLREDPRSCTVYYFDRNQVLVRDSNNSDWIYIVLKGSLSVIKKLQRVDPVVTPSTSRKRKRESFRAPLISKKAQRRGQLAPLGGSPSPRPGQSLSFHPGHDVRVPPLSPGGPETFRTPYELESKLEQTLPGYRNAKDRLGCLNYDNIIDNFRSRLVYKEPIQNGRGTGQNGTLSRSSQSEAGASSMSSSHHSRRRDPTPQDRVTSPGTSSTSLPDISLNNKTVQRHLGETQNHISQERSRGENGAAGSEKRFDSENRSGSSDDGDDEASIAGADDEQEKKSGGNSSRRHRRKHRHVSKTSKGVYLAPSQPADHTNDGAQAPQASTTAVEMSGSADQAGSPPPPPQPQHHQPDLNGNSDSEAGVKGADEEDTIEAKLARLQIQYQRRVIDREGRKTIAEELDHKARRDFKFTEADLDPTIIEVQVLERGQYFGLAPILFPDQSSLSVVSNGAECLVISKKLFMNWASEKCLRYLRQSESPFPSDQEFNRKLQEVVNWQANRAVVYQRLANQIAERKARRKQFLPTFQGEYCFRTGPA